jgi:hypothetical protein
MKIDPWKMQKCVCPKIHVKGKKNRGEGNQEENEGNRENEQKI